MPRKKKEESKPVEAKQKNTIFKRIIKFFVFLFVLMLLFFAAKILLKNSEDSGIFKLRNCRVEGESIVLSGEKAFDYCRLSPGQSLLDLDLEALRDAVLHAHLQLKDVSVLKNYPDTVKIFVEERKPFAQFEAKNFFIVDEDGFVLKKNFEKPILNLPLIIGVKSGDVKEGTFSRSLALKRGIEIIKILEAVNTANMCTVKKIDATNPNNISFYTQEDVEIKLGKGDFKRKIEKVNTRLANLDLSRIRYIDLRFKDLIIGPK